ncbi:MoxR family ATPase [Actinomadura sp. LCR2-06]|uniref:MoxR family ATPase n=1 Tax=Actinomadura violacea TaxID=2819934 RepID=A0ABS3RRG6_9ACTN|nr:MoxR family ATPase [Actinomadura violacea]
MTLDTPAGAAARCADVLDEVGRAVVGKRAAAELVLTGVLASGHVLIEDLPGLGKTLLARSFAAVLGLDFTRVQFTPDMLPADLTGAAVYDPRTSEVVFRPGPVFTRLLLADEINRTPPKTQAALLEAMEEHQVSIDGQSRPLPRPFVVLATDNPIEYEGTYPLPEAQLDRFALRIRLGHLTADEEGEMVGRRLARGSAAPALRRLAGPDDVLAMRESVEKIHAGEAVIGYAVAISAATRAHPKVTVGASSRATLTFMQVARAHALLAGRDYVLPEDLKAVAAPALAHRLVLRPEMWVRQITGEDIVAEVLAEVPVPRGIEAGHGGSRGQGAGGGQGGLPA